jgi:tetratricopeptide (TPR) repeat protein
MNPYEFVRQMSHADVLLSQGRFGQAEEILERLMATGYEGTDIMKMMAIAKMGLKKYGPAEELCRMIVSHHPNEAFAFYLLATIRGTERKYDEALSTLNEAIRLDPANADYLAFKANILLQTKDYKDALESADIGLSIDAENIDALNARASALVGLNRKEEAFLTINKSLASDPDNADTHANMGWGLLHQGKSDVALQHFKNALKQEPMNEYARSGMLEAMKARFPIYRYFLMLMLWLGKMKGNNQWGFIIGGYLVYRVLVTLAEKNEALQFFLIPVIVFIALFFISTWIFSPLMNLYLLSNPFGKLTLDEDQKQSARLVGISLLISLASIVVYFFLYQNDGLLTLSLFAFAMMIPLGSMNNPYLEANKRKLKYWTLATAILVLTDTVISIVAGTFLSSFSFLPLVALIGYQWYTNYILIRE